MTKTPEQRIALLEKLVMKQRVQINKQNSEIEKLWDVFRRHGHRIEQLRTAVPHVSFEEW